MHRPSSRLIRIAGALFVLNLLVPVVTWIVFLSPLLAAGDVVATAKNAGGEGSLFRLAIVGYIGMALVAVSLGVVLYALVRGVSRPFAQLALSLKVVEVVMSAVMAMLLLIVAVLLGMRTELPGWTPGQIEALVGSFLELHLPVTAVGGVFHGLNMVVFSALLFASTWVPRPLAGFATVAYVLIVAYDLMLIIAPDLAILPAVQTVGWGPSIIAELSLGGWLMFRGGS